MSKNAIKKMLYLTIRRRGDVGHIVFEMEPYYRNSKRYIIRGKPINFYDKKILLRDDELKESMGFNLIQGLFIYGKNEPEPENRVWSQIVYPHFRETETVLRIDTEIYRYKPTRIFCGDLLLPSLDLDVVSGDESFKRLLAEYVLTYLPLSEELCMMSDENDANARA